MENKYVIHSIDDVSFQLKEETDFTWLKDLGHVFTVFDQQDSGNISFGVKNGEKKWFVKYAGARTTEYTREPEEAVSKLIKSVELYNELQHPHLIQIQDHFSIGSGYAVIFEWFDGSCLHPHWAFPPREKYENPNSPFYKFINMPLKKRLIALEKIFNFHVFVEDKNYVAIDFYDGSILYDFNRNEVKICDIDYYEKKPFKNSMGRMWGSSRFMSPEEFELGAVIDSTTNVFNMGAVAFVLLGGGLDRSFSKWEASKEHYDVALRAVNKERTERYQSVKAFYQAWNSATVD